MLDESSSLLIVVLTVWISESGAIAGRKDAAAVSFVVPVPDAEAVVNRVGVNNREVEGGEVFVKDGGC